MTIGRHEIDYGKPVFVVAEMSCNHGQNYKRAVETIRAMAQAGAAAVKLQIDNPDGGITVQSDRPEFRITTGPWAGKTLYQLYRETYTPWDWIPGLKQIAEAMGIECFVTPSCLEGVAFLETVGVPAYKVASMEMTDHELLTAIALTGKPCVMSLGCATPRDIADAKDIFETRGGDYMFLECVSDYPADPSKFQLYQGMGGISDHSLGHEITWAAVALGALVVERHFILSRRLGGPDAGFSLEPEEFARMVEGIRAISAAKAWKPREPSQQWCKSVFAARDIAAGETLTRDVLLVVRPGAGLHPRELKRLVGGVTTRAIARHEPIREGDML